MTHPGLPTSECLDHQKPIPPSPNPTANQPLMWLHNIHRIWYRVRVQRGAHQRQRLMESGLHNQWRAVWTNGHVLRTNQLPHHIPNNDEHHLPQPYWQRERYHIHGWHSNTYGTKARRKPRRTRGEASKASPQITKDKQPPPEPRKMCVRIGPPWFPRCMCRGRSGLDGAIQSWPSQGMDPPPKHPQGLKIPWVHWLLPVLHPRVLPNCQTATRPHETGNDLALGWERATGIQSPEGQNGQQTYTTTTWLQQNVLSSNRHVKIQSRSSTIIGRSGKGGHTKETTPDHVLFCHLLTHWAKL